MIVFDLTYQCGVIFEGWFADSGDFASQQVEGLLFSCPACGGKGVRKILPLVPWE